MNRVKNLKDRTSMTALAARENNDTWSIKQVRDVLAFFSQLTDPLTTYNKINYWEASNAGEGSCMFTYHLKNNHGQVEILAEWAEEWDKLHKTAENLVGYPLKEDHIDKTKKEAGHKITEPRLIKENRQRTISNRKKSDRALIRL